MWFLAIFLILGHGMDLELHIMVVHNVLEYMAKVRGDA